MGIITDIFNASSLLFDAIAIFFILMAGFQLLSKFIKHPKVSGSYSLTDKHYHKIRSRFVHRIILALDFFIVGDLLRLAFASTTQTLFQILLIVVIRTILSFFLVKEIEMHR